MIRRFSCVLALLFALTAVACTSSAEPEPEEPSRSALPAASPSGSADGEGCEDIERLVQRTRRGYVPVRSPEVLPIPSEPNYIGTAKDPVHTGPWDYLAEVPLVFYGPGLIPERRAEEPVTLADLAPTTADLIGADFDAPDGKSQRLGAPRAPRLVVTIVWDGGGWNALREHKDSWPFLRKAARRGVSFENATLGSTPSNTPPIHTTIGTGAFPRTHGIPHVKVRLADGRYVDPYEGDKASLVRVPSLGDVYDRDRGNVPKVGVVATVNWHLGMIGHGAELDGADHDVAVLLDSRGLGYGESAFYDLADRLDPSGLEAATDRLDASDGARDGLWGEDDLSDPAVRYSTPAFTEYQESVLEDTIRAEGFGADRVPDLMYTNFKMVDDAGHRWGMTSRQVGDNIEAVDDALQRLTGFLDQTVGEGEWVVVVTADHGQTRYPSESGGWPIRGTELKADIEAALGPEIEVLRVTSSGIFLTDDASLTNGKAERVAEWMIGYTVRDNVPDGDDLPARWQGRGDAPLFDAVMAGRKLVATRCD